MGKLLFLFVGVPALELFLLIGIGARFGLARTMILIVLTGLIGAMLAKAQGSRVLAEVRGDLQANRVPADALIEGAMIFVAGALLMTPGLLTDAFGFACLIPPFRHRMRERLKGWFKGQVQEGRIHVASSLGFDGRPPDEGERVVDVEAEEMGETRD